MIKSILYALVGFIIFLSFICSFIYIDNMRLQRKREKLQNVLIETEELLLDCEKRYLKMEVEYEQLRGIYEAEILEEDSIKILDLVEE